MRKMNRQIVERYLWSFCDTCERTLKLSKALWDATDGLNPIEGAIIRPYWAESA